MVKEGATLDHVKQNSTTADTSGLCCRSDCSVMCTQIKEGL